MNLRLLRFNEHMDHGFGFALMASRQTKAYMERRATKAVNPSEYKLGKMSIALLILLPPLSEQRAIAAVLGLHRRGHRTLTEAVIAATEHLRDALLHELLTRGVPGWHTEWKEVTGIGTMPADWEVVRLGDVAEVRSGVGFPLDKQGRRSGDYPFIKVSDMTLAGNETYIVKANNYIERRIAIELGASPFAPGTVVFPKGWSSNLHQQEKSIGWPNNHRQQHGRNYCLKTRKT